MKYLSSLLFVCVLFSGFSQSDFDFFTSADHFFKTHCSDGKVNYEAVKSDADLPKLIEFIGANPSPAGQEKAYLINVYNLFVIAKITDKYPIGSPMDDSGFFTDKSFNLNGANVSLDHLENGMLILASILHSFVARLDVLQLLISPTAKSVWKNNSINRRNWP